jgi:hypothetical protein
MVVTANEAKRPTRHILAYQWLCMSLFGEVTPTC